MYMFTHSESKRDRLLRICIYKQFLKEILKMQPPVQKISSIFDITANTSTTCQWSVLCMSSLNVLWHSSPLWHNTLSNWAHTNHYYLFLALLLPVLSLLHLNRGKPGQKRRETSHLMISVVLHTAGSGHKVSQVTYYRQRTAQTLQEVMF